MKPANPLPSRPEQITASWLSRVLASSENAPRVQTVEVAETHSGTTGRARLRVVWQDSAKAPEQIFVKLPPTDPVSKEMVVSTGMGRREAQFYAELGGEVPVRIPEPIWSGWSDDGSRYVMLMEDLETSGCRFPGVRDPRLLEHAKALMRSLACLHARYWDTSRFGRDLTWVEAPMRHQWGRTLVESGLKQFSHEMPHEFSQLGRLYLDHTRAFQDALDRGPHTLIHGDCHLGNLFVDGDEIGFLDWACFSHAPGMRDVAYFLCNSLPTELRRSSENDLLTLYREALMQSGAPSISEQEIWRSYRRLAAYSWISGITTAAAGARMQSVRVGRAAMQRSQAAITDLETVSLLTSEMGVDATAAKR